MKNAVVYLFDAADPSPDKFITNLQETFMIAAKGSRENARPFYREHAIELIERFRKLGRTFVVVPR